MDSQSDHVARRLADDLLAIGEGLDSFINGLPEVGPQPGSSGHQDLSLDQGQGSVSLAGAIAFVTIAVASDHLRSTYGLIVDRLGGVAVHRYAIYSVLRVAMEVAALTWWLVDKDVSAKSRLTRALTVMENSRRMRENSEKLLTPSNDLAYLAAVRDAIEAEARKHNLQKITSRFDAGLKVAIPDAVDLVANQFAKIVLTETSARNAVAIYGGMSEHMHGNVFGVMSGFGPPDQERVLHPDVSLPSLATAAQFSAHGVVAAMLELVAYMGWDKDRWIDISSTGQSDLEKVVAEARSLTPVEEAGGVIAPGA